MQRRLPSGQYHSIWHAFDGWVRIAVEGFWPNFSSNLPVVLCSPPRKMCCRAAPQPAHWPGQRRTGECLQAGEE